MTEPAQPLSRRERRALEEAAAAAEGEVTQALPVAPESISILSRRERRRMERLANPLETWTAEEEMIATGQMPAMTPELLAEQEKIAEQERAAALAAAQADAEAAYAQTAPEPVAEVVEEAAAPEPAAPEPVAEEPVAEEPVAEEPVEEPADVDNGGIPAELRHLFPPGSLQARGLEAREPAPAATVNPEAADEIRRLTQEAMAGISRVTTEQTPTVPEAIEPETFEPEAFEPEPVAEQGVEQPSAAAPTVPELPVDVEELWNAPTVDEPARPGVAAEAVEAPVELHDVPFVEDVPHTTEPHAGEPAGGAPVWSALVPSNSQAPVNAQGPLNPQGGARVSLAPAGFGTAADPAPSMWDTHPLTNPGASPVRELPAEPVQRELPRPDLSSLLGTQASPSVGQTPYASVEPLTSTGAIPTRVAEPQAGGGARHFRWAHLAVIGAIAFVLGVLVWNIARSHT